MAGPWGDLRSVFVFFPQPKTDLCTYWFSHVGLLFEASMGDHLLFPGFCMSPFLFVCFFFFRVCDMLASKQGNAS